MTAPLGLYGAALRRAALGGEGVLHLVDADGAALRRLDPVDWTVDLRSGDASMLARCGDPTLDVGCGPGRLAAALAGDGSTALGIDISAEAVRQARRRGAWAVRADVFGQVPRERQWHTVLLADGNIGIGGDPVALLRRCCELMRPDGAIVCELDRPGDRTWAGYVRLRLADRQSTPFPWASVAADDVEPVACRAGLRVRQCWTEGERWFAQLTG